MKLRDMFYLRFGLFMEKTYGRTLAFIVEFLIIAHIAALALVILYGALSLAWDIYEETSNAHQKVAEAEAEAKGYQNALLTCLNGGIIGRTEDGETIGCQGAVTFRMGGVR